LSQVLINLIMNGMDAVMELAPAHRRVVVEAGRGFGESIDLAVHDTGTGIPADALARIFQPFYTTKASGMGMGLSVSRTIVAAHGGMLTAENASGGGAVFRVSLPSAQGGAA
jgi:C4-dicarboxylate-specific signal transduction histidine kinase